MHREKRLVSSIDVLLVISFCHTIAYADHGEPDPTEGSKLAEYALAGMFHGRDMLESGECDIVRSVERALGETAPAEHYYLAFDAPLGRWRFDLLDRGSGHKYAERDGESFRYADSSFLVVRSLIDRSAQHRWYLPMDPRVVGWVFDPRHCGPFSDLRKAVRSGTRVAGAKTVVGGQIEVRLVELTSVEDVDGAKEELEVFHELLIDPGTGFVPVRFKRSWDLDHNGVCDEMDEARTKWAKQSQVQVPVRCEIWDAENNVRTVYEFHWKAVNTDVPAERFHYSSFGVPPGTILADTRLGGEPIYETIGDVTSSGSPARRSLWSSLFIAALLLVLTVGAIWWLARRRRAS